jgi:hypothetical protein
MWCMQVLPTRAFSITCNYFDAEITFILSKLQYSRPAPFDRQGVTENDIIDFTPELRKQALAVLEKYN